jgi:drug/metabolite transporter (DMT)-like permease
MNAGNRANLATVMLLIAVVFWAATFIVVKEAVAVVDVFSFLSLRFLIASILLGLVFFKKFRSYNLETLKEGTVVGVVLAAALIFQTIGLQLTTPSTAAFVTGLAVVLVPIFVSVIDKKLPRRMQIAAVFLAFVGFVLLTLNSEFSLGIGDAWVFICAITFAIQLIMVGRISKNIDALMFTVTQLFTVGVITLIIGVFLNGRIVISDNPAVWNAILFCAIFAGGYSYAAQAYLQRYITETKAAIIFSFEPLFTAVIAYVYLGEMLAPRAIIGGLLIFFAMIIS